MNATALRAAFAAIGVTSLLGVAAGCGLPEVVGADDQPATSPSGPSDAAGSWEADAADIDGIVNFRLERPELLDREHRAGPIDYEVLPPPGGPHSDVWMNCEGDIYHSQIPSEHAVHSLEHGAVWVTYHPDLPDNQVETLAQRVEGNDYLFMSPFPDLDAPISLQAWGYQLKVDDANDGRIDEFVRVLAQNASMKGSGAPCSSGRTATGTGPTS